MAKYRELDRSVVDEFLRAVYGDTWELTAASFSEEAILRDVVLLIASLRESATVLLEQRDESRAYALRMRDALGRWAISGYDDPPWEEMAMEKTKTRVTVTVTLEVEHTSNRETLDVVRIARDSIWCGGTSGFDKDGSFSVREVSRSAAQEEA